MPREMGARSKLAEAEYFLAALKRTLHDPDRLHYNLSAFLSAWRSISDVMLYDFAWRYSLGFGQEDRLTYREFKTVAKVLKRAQALEFLRWWRDEFRDIKANPLYRKRNLVVHRGKPPLRYVLYLPTRLASELDTESKLHLGVETYRGKKAIVKADRRTASAQNAERRVGRFKTTFDVEFDDFPKRPLEDVCKEALDNTTQIVKTAEKEYWSRKPRSVFFRV